jgi:hypothetical protein
MHKQHQITDGEQNKKDKRYKESELFSTFFLFRKLSKVVIVQQKSRKIYKDCTLRKF